MRESLIETTLKGDIEKKGGLCLKLLPDFFNGLPDRIVLLPGARIDFVELKAPGKVPRRLQEWVHKKFRALGFKVLVLDTIEKVKNYTNAL